MSHIVLGVPLAKTLDEEDVASIKKLSRDLGAMGIRLSPSNPLPGDTLLFEYDLKAHGRGAGRKRKNLPPDSITREMTQEEFDEWLLRSSIEEIGEELGIGRATVFRRRAEARERLAYSIVPFDQ